ncbi:MAG TPA: hypothetical protein VEV65_14060 [Kineosporiaceae bacterium]|nr:hypothetical protein [Kineosporiaceae bacterium]
MTSSSSQPPDPDVPAYAGSADVGVRSSVPAGDPMAGDAAGLLRAEYGKLYDLYGDIVALLDAARFDEIRQRWFGVVRETLEFEAAVQRVVLPEVPDAASSLPDGTEPAALLDWLRAYDELNPDLEPDEVRTTATTTVEALEAQDRVLVPAVDALAPDLRDRLGEDLRQVMG